MKTNTQGSWAAAELRRYSDSKQAPAHTPGPWRIGDAGYTVFGPATVNPSPRTVARLPRLSVPCAVSAIDENIANARLIAAAPELLDALQQADAVLLRAYEAWGTNSQYNPERCALELCRSAIANATGKGGI